MTDRNDDILKSLMHETETIKAPAGFTTNVMQRIRAEEESWDSVWFFSPRYWVVIGLGLGIAVAFLFSYDLPVNIFSMLEPRNLGSMTGNLLQIYQSFLASFEVSSSAVIILISVLLLFFLDRILRKRYSLNFFSL